MNDREERIRRAAERFATAVAWEIFGLPIIVTSGIALGFLGLAVLSLAGLW